MTGIASQTQGEAAQAVSHKQTLAVEAVAVKTAAVVCVAGVYAVEHLKGALNPHPRTRDSNNSSSPNTTTTHHHNNTAARHNSNSSSSHSSSLLPLIAHTQHTTTPSSSPLTQALAKRMEGTNTRTTSTTTTY